MAKKKFNKTKVFTIVSVILFLFFVLPYTHSWANNFIINLHFCNHLACIVYSLIWLTFSIIGIAYWKNKKEISKTWIILSIVVLIVGIALMNMTYCDAEGKIHFAGFNFFVQSFVDEDDDVCKPGISCPVPIPPCLETDDGQDYISYGEITSGAFVDDICLDNGNLRERYCNSELTYTSEDIDCEDEYGSSWSCIEGECRYSSVTEPTPPENETEDENTADLCSDGIDNDDDGSIDCEDDDCLDEWCECGHGSIIEPPMCMGRCPTGEYCAEYVAETNSWCECVPEQETACGNSDVLNGIDCSGWCLNGDYCIHIPYTNDCYCSAWHCIDEDGGYYPEIPGCIYWEDIACDYCESQDTLIELTCGEDEPYYNEVDCSIFGENYTCMWGKVGAFCGEFEY